MGAPDLDLEIGELEPSHPDAFVAIYARSPRIAHRSLHPPLRSHFHCDKTKSFSFAPKGQS
jgi:hypothetical protein